MAEEKKGFLAGFLDRFKKPKEPEKEPEIEKEEEPEKATEEAYIPLWKQKVIEAREAIEEEEPEEEPEKAEQVAEAEEEQEEEEKKTLLDKITPSFFKKKEEKEEAGPVEEGEGPEKKGLFGGWFQRLKDGLNKTRNSFIFKVKGFFKLRNVIDDEFWEDLEDILITADVGLKTTDYIIQRMQEEVEEKMISKPSRLLEVMKNELTGILEQKNSELDLQKEGLSVIMVVGVNGTGKTTSIAKLANRLMQQDKKVLVAAADTFRAAAIEQLEVWSNKLGLELIKHKEGADPAAVVFDAVSAAKARNADALIIDTAGRLHSKVNLMKELEKIKRVVRKEIPDGPHETLLVLDATTGQNALIQAKTFGEFVDVTGTILTKLDGTAKGGVIIGIVHELGIPVKFIGIGEGVYDLRPFDAEHFLDALFSEEEKEEQVEAK